MSAAYAWLAIAAAAAIIVVAVLLAAHGLPAAVAALLAALVAAMWRWVLWRTRTARRRDYHRHGRPGVTHHIRPTHRRRARFEATVPAAPTTVPDARPFTARTA
ncbi:hypothetical protein [Actinoallomurus sp. CA-142502]|uniref:hypothetical protein n=1 Tax=Actinoallomurus sp. CA-142502 TaxID=3239885 RepID=UPI003D8D5E89